MQSIEELSAIPSVATAASCVLTIPTGAYAAISNGDVFTVGHRVFEFRKSGDATAGRTKVDLGSATDEATTFDAVKVAIEAYYDGILTLTAINTTSGTLATVGTGTAMNARFPVTGLADKIAFTSTTGGKLDGALDAVNPTGVEGVIYTYTSGGTKYLAIYDGAWYYVALTAL